LAGGIVGHNFERGPFHQSLVQIDPVVLEELIKIQKANDRRTPSGSNSSHDPSGSGELIKNTEALDDR